MLQARGCELWLQGYGLGLSYFLCCSLCRVTTDLLAHAALLVFLWQIYHQLLNAAATTPVLPATGLQVNKVQSDPGLLSQGKRCFAHRHFSGGKLDQTMLTKDKKIFQIKYGDIGIEGTPFACPYSFRQAGSRCLT